MPILRARAEQGDAQLVPIIELDVSSGIMRTVDSGVLGRPMPYTHLIARCRLLPTPQIITVFNNRVTFVEDWSQRE
jgi:hypothetical protein